jgi:NADH-quinone oxidoreductase subunit L
MSPDAIAAVAGGAPYQLLVNKYYVDEIYWAVFGRTVLGLSRAGAWFDLHVIDGLVDGSAALTRGIARLEGLFDTYVVDALVTQLANAIFALGARVRRLQTGTINTYLYVVVGTVTLVLIARLL